ncbi:MATE efflux family protein [Striga asiatica]|uniref:MATE efflux family protein n=1 Tax=Striga asiatica TaxID=4170 RepID=A0A5A7QIM5_STRAF|nr:MATE efflux family protein [Striga asiatica]
MGCRGLCSGRFWYFMSIIVLTVCMNLNGWEGMLFIGVNATISVRVSNELGPGHPRAAKFKYSVFVIVFESLLIGLLSMVIITKDHFAILFTSSVKMQKEVSDLA